MRHPLASLDRESDSPCLSRGIIPQWRIDRALPRLLFDADARACGDFDRLTRRYRRAAHEVHREASLTPELEAPP